MGYEGNRGEDLSPGDRAMDGRNTKRSGVAALVLLAASLSPCGPRGDVESLPTVEATLAGVGKRLSRTLSAGELTAVAASSDRVLAVLRADERDALARGAFRFKI